MPKKQPTLGREPGRKVGKYKQPVRRIRLLCTKSDELVRLHHPPVRICSHLLPITPMLQSRKLFMQIWSSNSLLDVPEVLFQKVANAAFGVPNVREGDSWYGRQISSVQKRKFLPMFSCDMLPPLLARADSMHDDKFWKIMINCDKLK